MAGLPRRYYTNTAFPYFDDLANINVVITVFALIAGAAQLVSYTTLFTVFSMESKLSKIPGAPVH